MEGKVTVMITTNSSDTFVGKDLSKEDYEYFISRIVIGEGVVRFKDASRYGHFVALKMSAIKSVVVIETTDELDCNTYEV